MHKMKKILPVACLVFSMGAASHAAASHIQNRCVAPGGSGLMKAHQISMSLRKVANQYGLTQGQREKMKAILLDNLPAAIDILKKMQANRMDLLELTAGKTEIDEAQVADLAEQQGILLADLIVWKERLKAQLRTVLTEEQLSMLEDMAQVFMLGLPASPAG